VGTWTQDVQLPSAANPSIENFDSQAGRVKDERNWYAVYTRANQEKIAFSRFSERSFESWLPTYETVRQWKDRRVRMRFPLFPSYIFVRLALRERIRVLEVPGIVRLVGFGGLPTPLTAHDVSAIRNAMNCTCTSRKVEPCAQIVRGARVRIVGGPFEGMEGVVSRKKGNLRVVMSLDSIKGSFMVEVDQTEIRLMPSDWHPPAVGGS
jgi:transcription termination/antitermination protein NusG